MEILVNFFNEVNYSITRLNKYPEMAKEGTGKAFKYLLIFTLIFGTIGGLGLAFNLKSAFNQIVDFSITELPEFQLQNGELDVEGEMPIIYEEDGFAFIIDDTGNTTAEVLDEYYGGFLFLKHGIVQKTTYQIQEYSYSDFGFISFNKQDLLDFLAKIEGFSTLGLIILIIVYLIVFYIAKMFAALILTIVGLILATIQKSTIPFSNLYAMGIYALTVPILLDITLSLFDSNLAWYFYYGIASAYLWFAIKNWKETKQPEEDIIKET